ncbi:hypothetical protein K435DRAFT_831538 [Dendrothele bispora CBS 962.96]|uniref:EthD domain-containing protein n=1 Tax=Dendrothele bispora (strain CBS 962.96) TaxID=1314807 RepID=A0A4S8L472_DENBC|nr:hypothetical protein K435DRAFT_831538 [Dendrothele bispora CBS 962.96]
MAPGFLIVYSEPGKEVTLEEFQDWYDNEHVPLRLNHLTSFLSGARYSASDSKVPGCVALYDIDDTATFSHESYTRLRANCSPREAALVKRLEILDRRTCEAHTDSGESTLTSSLKSAKPTKYLVTHGIAWGGDEESDKAVREWAESLVASMKGNSEWIRTRTFRVIDSLKTGLGIPEGPEGQKVPIYFAVSEFLTSVSAESYSKVVATTLSNSPKIVIEEIRNWDLYRAYPGVGQGNLPV